MNDSQEDVKKPSKFLLRMLMRFILKLMLLSIESAAKTAAKQGKKQVDDMQHLKMDSPESVLHAIGRGEL